MLNEVLALVGIHRTGMILQIGSSIIKAFDQEFAQDHNAKIVSIDSVIKLLNSHKEELLALCKNEEKKA